MPNAGATRRRGAQRLGDGYSQSSLYQNVVIPGCATLPYPARDNNNSDLDFQTYAKFLGYSDRIKAHVIDRGNMPSQDRQRLLADRLQCTRDVGQFPGGRRPAATDPLYRAQRRCGPANRADPSPTPDRTGWCARA